MTVPTTPYSARTARSFSRIWATGSYGELGRSIGAAALWMYNHGVPTFMCRWPNGDLSFVSARNKEDAIVMLDEWDNAELAELSRVPDFMVDFRLNDDGELELQDLGEGLRDVIWKKA